MSHRWNSVLLKIIHSSLSFASGTISKVCIFNNLSLIILSYIPRMFIAVNSTLCIMCSLGAETRTGAFADLKKHTCDNMSAYLARKEERIKEQQEKKAKHELKRPPAENIQRGIDQDRTQGTVELVCNHGQSSTSDTEQTVDRSSVDPECSLGESRDFAVSEPPEKKN